MNSKVKNQLITSLSLILAFILFTISLKFVDVKAIGPLGSSVAYAGINKFVHELFGVHFVLYNITDWLGIIGILIPLIFAVIGLIQLIKRKSLLKVDKNILVLGAYYIVVIAFYVFFELVKINFRPVLIEGVLETSYPSSTTMLIMCVVPTAIIYLKNTLENKTLIRVVEISGYAFTVLMVFIRLVSGVHWFTDIFGGALLSLGLIFLYLALKNFVQLKEN